MGNFEKLSVLVIVVIIVMILVVALYTWSDNPGDETPAARVVTDSGGNETATDPDEDTRGPESLLDDWDRQFSDPPSDPAKGEEIEQPPTPVPTPDPTPIPDPAPAPAPEPAPVEEEWMYTVKAGDTLTEISERELGTWRRYKEILKLNVGLKAESLREGDTIKMPPRARASSVKTTADGKAPAAGTKTAKRGKITVGDWYVIRRGDRLSRISKSAYGTIDRWPELWARNLSVIDDPDAPPVGAKIFILK